MDYKLGLDIFSTRCVRGEHYNAGIYPSCHVDVYTPTNASTWDSCPWRVEEWRPLQDISRENYSLASALTFDSLLHTISG